jgi:UDP-glucose 4-epimerase
VRIAITGASGNLGTALIRALRASDPGVDIVGICRRPPQEHTGGVEWRPMDLSSPAVEPLLTRGLEGADAVVHLAWAIQPARDAEYLHAVNVGGTAVMLRAAASAGVPHVIHASSLGVYAGNAPAPVDESWPPTGVPSSTYSRHKVEAEELVRRFELDHPDRVVARVRPTLVMQRSAAAEIAGLFLGPLIPIRAVKVVRGRLPIVPLPAGVQVQFVHADDVADAFLRILERRASGAFNLAADVLGPAELAGLFGKRPVEVPVRVARAFVNGAFHAHAIRTSPGWFDLLMQGPLLDATRARTELGWEPRRSSTQAVDELLDGFAENVHGPTPALLGR